MIAIDEGMFVNIHGIEQWVTIRGSDLKNPVLLMVSGPGAAFSRMAPFFAPWEKNFTLVQWDQPGAGATYAKNGDSPLTIDRLVRDGIGVTELILRRLHADKLVVLGASGGTIIGLTMVKRRPELFSAYVGSGQIVNWSRQEALSYAMVLDQARAAGDEKAVVELEQIGAPPYKDAATDAIKSKYAAALTPAEQAAFDPAVMAVVNNPPADARYVATGLETHDMRTVAMAAYESLRGEILAFDARLLGLVFDVPMFFFQGERDAYTVSSEVCDYEEEIRAPKKMVVLIQGGGHSSVFMGDEFLRLLRKHVAGPGPALQGEEKE
jgi:pimeloyl-ACP methyl ester carboxylesterase